MCLVAVLIIAFFVLGLFAPPEDHAKRKQIYGYFFLLITYCVLGSTSTTLFHYLVCDEFDEILPSEAFLAKDYSVSCNSDRYLAFRWYAIAMIMVYPVGESIRQQP